MENQVNYQQDEELEEAKKGLDHKMEAWRRKDLRT
jgi:hypothetical protein